MIYFYFFFLMIFDGPIFTGVLINYKLIWLGQIINMSFILFFNSNFCSKNFVLFICWAFSFVNLFTVETFFWTNFFCDFFRIGARNNYFPSETFICFTIKNLNMFEISSFRFLSNISIIKSWFYELNEIKVIIILASNISFDVVFIYYKSLFLRQSYSLARWVSNFNLYIRRRCMVYCIFFEITISHTETFKIVIFL